MDHYRNIVLASIIFACNLAGYAYAADTYDDVDLKDLLEKSQNYINRGKQSINQVELSYVDLSDLNTEFQNFLSTFQKNSETRNYYVMTSVGAEESKCFYKCLIADYKNCGYIVINTNACSIIRDKDVPLTPGCENINQFADTLLANSPVVYDDGLHQICNNIYDAREDAAYRDLGEQEEDSSSSAISN